MLGDVLGLTGHRDYDLLALVADDVQESVSLHGEDVVLELACVCDDVRDCLCRQVEVGRVVAAIIAVVGTKCHRIGGSRRHQVEGVLPIDVTVGQHLDTDVRLRQAASRPRQRRDRDTGLMLAHELHDFSRIRPRRRHLGEPQDSLLESGRWVSGR